MEAANRWETEAIRESRDRRRARPTVSQQRTTSSPDGDWRTLREASDETGVPVGTLRKWCRRESVNSYLESDGEQTLRMLEMGSVEEHARATGRDLAKGESREATRDRRQAGESRQTPVASPQPKESYQLPATSHQPETSADPGPSTAGGASTMIVPVDAWNKMLNQLGNLHEAGQQLAEARERAGKAETEVKFLRERLGEMRENSRQSPVASPQPEPEPPLPSAESSSSPSGSSSSPSGGGGSAAGADGGGQSVPIEATTDPNPVPPAEGRGDRERSDAGRHGSRQAPVPGPQVETTSFWRYVVRGWRGRRR